MNCNTGKIIILSFALMFLSGCARKTFTSAGANPYREDLSRLRPKYEYSEEQLLVKNESVPKIRNQAGAVAAQPDKSVDDNEQVSRIIDAMSQHNKGVKFMSGYRIQLYVGNVRAEADAAKSYIYKSFPSLIPYVTFSQPTYRVKAGDFMTRTDAEHFLESMKLQYASAVILPDKIEIKKGLQIRLGEN